MLCWRSRSAKPLIPHVTKNEWQHKQITDLLLLLFWFFVAEAWTVKLGNSGVLSLGATPDGYDDAADDANWAALRSLPYKMSRITECKFKSYFIAIQSRAE